MSWEVPPWGGRDHNCFGTWWGPGSTTARFGHMFTPPLVLVSLFIKQVGDSHPLQRAVLRDKGHDFCSAAS